MVNVIPMELKMRITKVYTRGGDKGETGLVGGGRISKDDPRIEAYGTVDELNSILGMVRAFDPPHRIDEIGATIQNDLFNVGTDLATPADKRWEGMYLVGDSDVLRLEQWIDELNADLEPLREFILPGGGACGALLHQARTVCRRAERRVMTLMSCEDDVADGSLRYLNRLSDFLFVAARWSAKEQGAEETFWKQPGSQD
jgi:cob(I)alamin adenosyltransferase